MRNAIEANKKEMEIIKEQYDQIQYKHQLKEKKWFTIEKILKFYAEEDEELRERLREYGAPGEQK